MKLLQKFDTRFFETQCIYIVHLISKHRRDTVHAGMVHVGGM